MQCPACHHRIGILPSTLLTVSFFLRKYKHCPYCGINIYRQMNPTWEYFKLIGFVIGWFGIFLFLLAIIFGRQVGYETALRICFWFWLVVVLVFMVIVLGNLGVIFLQKIFKK